MWPLSATPTSAAGRILREEWGAPSIFIGVFSGRYGLRCRWLPEFSHAVLAFQGEFLSRACLVGCALLFCAVISQILRMDLAGPLNRGGPPRGLE